MKILRKPCYLGTSSQLAEMRALAESEGSYADRHRAARTLIGKSLIGQRVALVRVGKLNCVVAPDDIAGLPAGTEIVGRPTLAHCDDSGVIALD